MASHTLKKLPKNTVEIMLTVTKDEIEAETEKAFEHLYEQLELKGFRKGKAPKDMARQHIRREAILDHAVKDMLPRLYQDVVQKEALKPVISPKIDLIKAKDGEDWVFRVSVAQQPTVSLGDYKKATAKVKADSKVSDIWVPGKDKEIKPEADNQKVLSRILDSLLKESKVEVSELIIEEELNNRLARLVDDVQKLGLTTDSYLKSRNLSMDDLRKQYTKEIDDMYKLEFILIAIADEAQIKVENEDLEKLFTTIKDEKERQSAQANAYLYASVLRKQKTLDYLLGL